jgi:hypothetical protein
VIEEHVSDDVALSRIGHIVNRSMGKLTLQHLAHLRCPFLLYLPAKQVKVAVSTVTSQRRYETEIEENEGLEVHWKTQRLLHSEHLHAPSF